MNERADTERVRLDRWLTAARMFKTRAMAVEAIVGGKIHLNGRRARRAGMVKVGDRLRVRRGPFEYHLIVRGLAVRRGPASEAEKLYEETETSREARTLMAAQMRAARPVPHRGKGRPTKKARRDLDRLRRKSGG